MCFLLKHTIGDCTAHFDGFDQYRSVSPYRQKPEEVGQEAGEAAGDDQCHLSAYNRRLLLQSPN